MEIGQRVADAARLFGGGARSFDNSLVRGEGDERRQARRRNCLDDRRRVDARDRSIRLGAVGSGEHGCPDPRHHKTCKRQPPLATKAWGGTEKAELRMNVLGREHGTTYPDASHPAAFMGGNPDVQHAERAD